MSVRVLTSVYPYLSFNLCCLFLIQPLAVLFSKVPVQAVKLYVLSASLEVDTGRDPFPELMVL